MHYAYIIVFQQIKTYKNYIIGRFLTDQGILQGIT